MTLTSGVSTFSPWAIFNGATDAPLVSYTVFKTVNNVSSNIFWNNTTTWVGGVIPPTDGSADVEIQAFNGTYSNANFVAINAGNASVVTDRAGIRKL